MVCRIVLGTSAGIDSKIQAVPLSRDHTPYLPDESARCTASGAIILSFGHIDPSTAPGDEDDDVEDPPRVWASGGSYPGTAFTRSLGDAVAEGLGVFAEPEMVTLFEEREGAGAGERRGVRRREQSGGGGDMLRALGRSGEGVRGGDRELLRPCNLWKAGCSKKHRRRRSCTRTVRDWRCVVAHQSGKKCIV